MNEFKGISIIVPFLNEEETLVLFCNTIDKYALSQSFEMELVFVDDGSTDDSVEIIKKYPFGNIKSVKIISFSKNFGSHAAIRAGIQNTTYDICTWLCCDLQEPLSLLEYSYEKICGGYDAVYIEKKNIRVSKINRLFSKMYSYLMRKCAVKEYTSGGTGTIVFNYKLKEYLNNNVEINSSIMLQIIAAGFKTTTLSLEFNERSAGQSKWTLAKKIKLFIDSFVAFSFVPIRMVSIVGIIIFLLGLLIGLFTIVNKFTNPSVPIGYSTLASIVAVGFGITNISLGIIAEYLWRTYDAARNRKAYIISNIEILK